MVIWLANRNLEELVRIPLSLEEGRLSICPHKENNVYIIDGNLYHYQLLSESNSDIAQNMARVRTATHTFKNGSGAVQNLTYLNIELWDRIPEEFRDIFFYHEVVEWKHFLQGFLQPIAHGFARAADLLYRQKYLSAEQQERFMWVEQQLWNYSK